MTAFKDTFSDRLNAAAEARKAALDKFQARPGKDDPAVRERDAARAAVKAAREQRDAERKAAKEAEAARIAAEKARQEAEAMARQEAAAAEKARQQKAFEDRKKAERDIRYALRKARK